jgi:hypothetical protein
MLFYQFRRSHHHFHGDYLETNALKAADDFTDKTALYAVGFDDEESAFVFGVILVFHFYYFES